MKFTDTQKAGGAETHEDVYMAIADGHRVYLARPQASDWDPRRTARALSNVRRYSGNYGPYSVAQHAVLVSEVAERLCYKVAAASYSWQQAANLALAGLHHDDAESVMGDIPQPVKAVMPHYCSGENPLRKLEAALEWSISQRYGVNINDPRVKEADRIVFCAEVRCIIPPEHQAIYGEYGNPEYRLELQPSWTDFEFWSADEAEKRYLERHDECLEMIREARAVGY